MHFCFIAFAICNLTFFVEARSIEFDFNSNIVNVRPVFPGDAGDVMAPPDFGRTVKPISTKVGRLCTPNNTGTPGFSDLPTALREAELLKGESVCIDRCIRINIWTFMKVLAKS